MKNIIKKTFGSVLAASVIAVAFAFTPITTPASAADCSGGINGGVSAGIDCANNGQVPTTLFGNGSIFTTVVNVLLFIIGAISVIMLIWGGIRYTTSAGNASSVTAAKNTIMYAIIGLVIAFLAFAIVNWVLGAITPA